MRKWPKRAAQRVQHVVGATAVIERLWAARVARDLIVTARRPVEDDLSLYRRLIDETVETVADLNDRAAQERLELEELVQLVDARLEQECEIARQRIAAAEAVLEADKERRRIECKAKQAETRACRAIEGSERDGVISRHVLVDPGAWQALAREARRQRTTLMTLAGEALASEAAALAIGEVTGTPSSRRRRSPGEREPRPADRVVRLDLGVEAWETIADAAAAAEISTARYAGEVLEAAGHVVGWRGPISRARSV